MLPKTPSGWPAYALETLGRCPVCGGSERTVVVERARDLLFGSPKHEWTYWKCAFCKCIYLDPRPSKEHIGLAYLHYYTHEMDRIDIPFPAKGISKRIAFSYYEKLCAGKSIGSSFIMRFLPLIFGYVKKIDITFRYAYPLNRGLKLLDYGCGSGAYLELMKHHGWQVVGFEPDPSAASVAQERGIPILQDQGELEKFREEFDMITVSHVIEHIHDPGLCLALFHRLLKRGGKLFIDTPNADSLGMRIYKEFWRGLEPPRHLVIYCPKMLKSLLERHGFEVSRIIWRKEVSKGICEQSAFLREKALGSTDTTHDKMVRWFIRRCQSIYPKVSEFFSVIATKRGTMGE